MPAWDFLGSKFPRQKKKSANPSILQSLSPLLVSCRVPRTWQYTSRKTWLPGRLTGIAPENWPLHRRKGLSSKNHFSVASCYTSGVYPKNTGSFLGWFFTEKPPTKASSEVEIWVQQNSLLDQSNWRRKLFNDLARDWNLLTACELQTVRNITYCKLSPPQKKNEQCQWLQTPRPSSRKLGRLEIYQVWQ